MVTRQITCPTLSAIKVGTLVLEVLLAPYCSITSTTGACPLRAAQCRAVSPSYEGDRTS